MASGLGAALMPSFHVASCASPTARKSSASPLLGSIRRLRPVGATSATATDTHSLGAPYRGQLLNEKTSFAEQYWVRGYEVEPDQTASITSMGNLLQECATNHAVSLWGKSEELGFAVAPVMAENDLILVMTRQQLQFERYPKWGDLVEVETWYQQEGRLSARRDWLVRDGLTQEKIGGGTSTWVMVNMKTRRLSKIPDAMRDEFLPFAPNPPRYGLGDAASKLRLPELQIPAQFEAPPQVARQTDIDMNGHMNNVTYIGLAMEAVPSDVLEGMQMWQVEVDFKAECMAGDTIECHASLTEVPEVMGAPDGAMAVLHVVRKCDDQDCKELVRMRSVWKPKGV